MQPGGALLAFFFVTRPVPPLTCHAAILDVLARIAHLEVSAALATLGGTARHRIWVAHSILCIRYVFRECERGDWKDVESCGSAKICHGTTVCCRLRRTAAVDGDRRRSTGSINGRGGRCGSQAVPSRTAAAAANFGPRMSSLARRLNFEFHKIREKRPENGGKRCNAQEQQQQTKRQDHAPHPDTLWSGQILISSRPQACRRSRY